MELECLEWWLFGDRPGGNAKGSTSGAKNLHHFFEHLCFAASVRRASWGKLPLTGRQNGDEV